MKTFADYNDWKTSITQRAGIDLTETYCAERAAALSDPADPKTREFRRTYGDAYCDQVISWFEKAREQASSDGVGA